MHKCLSMVNSCPSKLSRIVPPPIKEDKKKLKIIPSCTAPANAARNIKGPKSMTDFPSSYFCYIYITYIATWQISNGKLIPPIVKR